MSYNWNKRFPLHAAFNCVIIQERLISRHLFLSSLLSYCDYKASNYSYSCMRTRSKCLRKSLIEKVLLSFSLSWLPRFQVNAFFAEVSTVLRCLLFTQLQLRVLQVYKSISISLKRLNELFELSRRSYKKCASFFN